MIALSLNKKEKAFIATFIVVGSVVTAPIAKAIDFGAIFSAGSSLFQSLSSGDFNLGSIFNIANDVSGISGALGGPSLGNLSSSLGNLSSSPRDYGLGSGSFEGGDFESGSGLDGNFSTTSGIGGFNGGGNNLGLNQDTFEKVARSSDYIRGLYGSIQSRSVGGSIQNVLGIAGLFGLLDANDIAAQPGSGGQQLGNPSLGEIPSLDDEMRDAKYPIDAFYVGAKRQNLFRGSDYDISRIVLGKDGQAFTASQAKEQSLALAVGEESSKKVAEYVGSAAKLNEAQEKAVKIAEKLVDQGIKTKQSLDGIHALIALGGLHSKQFAMFSSGQTLQTAGIAQLSRQQNAGNAINKINGDHLRKIELQTAATARAVTITSGEIESQRQHELGAESAEASFVLRSQTNLRMPGLFSSGGDGGK